MPSMVGGTRSCSALVALVLAVVLTGCSGAGNGSSPSSASGDGNGAETPTADGGGPVDGGAEGAAPGPVAAPVRNPNAERFIYFVMPDRFANGDEGNDRGGVDGGPLETGFLPTDTGYHHGGDLIGLTDQLDYLEGLGVGAIWITPPFTNRYVQGDGTVEGSSSSYHGYWQIDWSRVDPHLGTDDDMAAFVEAAHARDMLVFFDVVLNHTGDVISYADGNYGYVPTNATPYVDADGNEFDLASVAGSDDFPTLDPDLSFPHRPSFSTPELAGIKKPEWLNDVTVYHNRGDSTFNGESVLYGDFFGLDDLFTEDPRVVEGMTDLHIDLIRRYDVDGFRVDTMKHVNTEFWASFAPAVTEAAAALGKDDFFLFGEVAGEDPILQSSYTNVGVSGTLDFVVDGALNRYVAGGGNGSLLADAFDNDDWFTDADNNASMQVTFFGNHDEGRMGYAIDRANPSADDGALVARMKLGFDLLFLTRGAPVVYYGDEQGFVGTGGDQLARQDMFPSLTPEYQAETTIGGGGVGPGDDNFNPDHPLYGHIAALAAVRAEHEALRTGAQVVHPTDGPTFAFSRIDRDERVEYVVVTNANGSLTVPARFAPLSGPGTVFEPVALPGGAAVGPVTVDDGGELVVEVPPVSTVLLRATAALAVLEGPTTIGIVRPENGAELPTPRYRIEAELGDDRYAEVTFAASVDGGEPQILGVDDAAPYRLYWSNAALADGAEVELIATVDDGSGTLVADRVTVTLGAGRN